MTNVTLIGALVFCLTNFVRSLRAKDTDAVVTQLAAWFIGYLVVVLVVHAGFAGGVPVLDKTLDHLNTYGQIIAGMLASSLFGFGNNVLAAIDNSRTSKVPDLVPPPGSPNA